MLDINNCMLFIVDIQDKLLNSVFNIDSLKNRANIIAKSASILGLPIFVTEQYPKGLGNTIPTIKNTISKQDIIIEKTDFNALADNEICNVFSKIQKKQILLCGIETHICVFQTAEVLINKGYVVTIIADACGSRNETEHLYGLENLKNIGAKVKTTEMVIFELLKSAKHPNFKEIQNLIK